MPLNNNSLAFIALCNEYCAALENARDAERSDFLATMAKLLPRIYITATDLNESDTAIEETYIPAALDEEYYDSVRRAIEDLMGPDDTYLEVFEEDMKYSDTPIAASIAEGLTDIFQVLYNFIEMVRDTPADITAAAITAIKEDFYSYWSTILCNIMRPINTLVHQ